MQLHSIEQNSQEKARLFSLNDDFSEKCQVQRQLHMPCEGTVCSHPARIGRQIRTRAGALLRHTQVAKGPAGPPNQPRQSAQNQVIKQPEGLGDRIPWQVPAHASGLAHSDLLDLKCLWIIAQAGKRQVLIVWVRLRGRRRPRERRLIRQLASIRRRVHLSNHAPGRSASDPALETRPETAAN